MLFVAINGNFGLPNVCEVILDQQTAVEEAVRYCYNQGRRHIGMVYKKQSRSDVRKYTGFLDGLCECDLKAERMVEVNQKSIENGKHATAQLLRHWPDTDAILYSSDTLAVGGAHCAHRLQQLGQRVRLLSAADFYRQQHQRGGNGRGPAYAADD